MEIELHEIKNRQIQNNQMREQELKRIKEEKKKKIEKEIEIEMLQNVDFNENIDESSEKFGNLRSNDNELKPSFFKQLDKQEIPNSEKELNKLPLNIIDIVNKLVDVKLKTLLNQIKTNDGNELGNKNIKYLNVAKTSTIKNDLNPDLKSPLIKQVQKEKIDTKNISKIKNPYSASK